MKKLLIYCLICWGSNGAFAQDGSKLTLPSTPAFSILDFEPSTVMRPTTNKGLASDILNSFDKNGKLLMNLGLEVSPYWLKSRPALTRKEYLEPSFKQIFLQSLSLSAATVKDTITGNNKLGVGFRFKLHDGKPVADLEAAEQKFDEETTLINFINTIRLEVADSGYSIQQTIDMLLDLMTQASLPQEMIDGFRQQAYKWDDNFNDSPRDVVQFLDKLISVRSEENHDLYSRISELQYVRKGLILELAGAGAFKTSGDGNNERFGFWVNASHYVSPDDLFTLTARYMHATKDTTRNNFDLALSFLKKTDKFNISLEGALRWYREEVPAHDINNQPILKLEKDFTYRIAFQSSYLFTKDISINISIGKDFNSPYVSRNGYFSILGLNYSLFNKQKVEVTE